MHGLPLTYNKDMQEDKEHLFDTADTLALSLAAARGMLETVSFRRERMAAAASDEMIAAVDLADLLVRAASRSARRTASSPTSFASRSTRAAAIGFRRRGARGAMRRRSRRGAARVLQRARGWSPKVSQGGTALARVREQLEAARAALVAAVSRFYARRSASSRGS